MNSHDIIEKDTERELKQTKEEEYSSSEGDGDILKTQATYTITRSTTNIGEHNTLQGKNGPVFVTKSGKKKHKKERGKDEKLDTETYADLWHRRFGHISLPVLRKLLSQQGYRQIPTTVSLSHCKVCALSKLTEKSYDQQRYQASRPGEVVYADLIGPVTPSKVPYNYKYILTTIDSYTRYAQIFPLRKKSNTNRYLKILF